MSIRTDLISEENIAGAAGFKTRTERIGGTEIQITEITDETAAKSVKKPCGKYCTVRFDRLDTVADTLPLRNAVIFALGELLPDMNDNALVVGLGNADITPDALGPACAEQILATRHITDELKRTLDLEGLHNVSCIVPGVLGKTGIEAMDIIKATAAATAPDVVLAIDALAAKTPESLCRTIQLTDSGIAPGSGVKNERKALNRQTLNVPVIAIGMPTVIDADCVTENTGNENMMVTPKEIDLLIKKSSSVIAGAINLFFQPELDAATIESLS